MSPGDATHGPQVVATLPLAGLNYGAFVSAFSAIDTSNADPTQHYIYFGATPSSGGGQVFRVRLSDFSNQGEENVSVPGMLRFATISSPVHHYLYFIPAVGQSPWVLKATFRFLPQRDGIGLLDLSSSNSGQGTARPGLPVPTIQCPPVFDVADNLLYIGTSTYDPSPGLTNINSWPYNHISPSLASIQAHPTSGRPALWRAFSTSARPARLGQRGLRPGRRRPDLWHRQHLPRHGGTRPLGTRNGRQPMQELGTIHLLLDTFRPFPRMDPIQPLTQRGRSANAIS